MKVLLGCLAAVAVVTAGTLAYVYRGAFQPAPAPLQQPVAVQPTENVQVEATSTGFGMDVVYEAPTSTVNAAIAKDFDIKTVANIADMEKAYGFTFTPAELKALSENKFVMKALTDTSIKPNSSPDNAKEFVQLYEQVKGQPDVHDRGPQNSIFFSSDVFLNAYNNLYVELLKEMENKTFYPAMRSLTKSFYERSSAHLASATTDADRKTWTKVRNYFAVPYAIFENAATPLTEQDYLKDAQTQDPAKVQADFAAKDATVDTYDNATAFVKKLKLDATSETAVLADLKKVFDANDKSAPDIFADEYAAYADQEKIALSVDFSQFTPRGTYTSSSLRREYFRGMKWYIMLPFFLKSADLTTYAYAVSQLMAEDPASLADYSKLESAIGFMVGESDDLMPVDYLQALAAGKGTADPSSAAMDYLVKAHNPKIKDLAAIYPEVGTEQSADVLLKTKGMRFFSGKFIIDSYWTGYLTQGDEALRPGYDQKLPPMASSLEVMTLLGSDYARTQIPKLDFYLQNNSKAIDHALKDLETQNATMTDADWMKNLYTAWMWTISSLFTWQKANLAELPRFMQSPLWDAKTLMTASGFWTELRHATILYAKQSFAERGGGPGECDPRKIPAPPKAYIEPQAEAYARLEYLATRTFQGLKDQGFGQLNNMGALQNFISMMGTVRSYVDKELGNAKLDEQIISVTGPDNQDPTKTCTQEQIQGTSDWETLRLGIISGLEGSLPVPTEGPVLLAKDKRAAIVADVHTGGDSTYPPRILYEGTGVPYVIFTAVSDANGPRLTVGFTYSQYEFTKEYGGQRMTDEDWQKNFYQGDDTYNAYNYTSKDTWPKVNAWYAPLFDLK